MFFKQIQSTLICARRVYLSATTYAKKEIPFKYVRTKKPESIFTTGDKEGLQTVDATMPVLKYDSCNHSEKLDPMVKKLISLEFAPQKEVFKVQRRDMMRSVQRHPLDTGSMEARIAAATVAIRRGQDVMRRFPQNKAYKVVLHNTIDQRKKMLKELRKLDYTRFEWLLEKLQITYQPPKLFYHWTTRKGTLRKMTEEDCVRRRKNKIDEYKAKLKSVQSDFLKEKEDTLKWIAKEKKELNVE